MSDFQSYIFSVAIICIFAIASITRLALAIIRHSLPYKDRGKEQDK